MAIAMVIGPAAAFTAPVAGAAVPGQVTGVDALHSRVRTELATFTNWLKANGAQGYIGEVGWPNNSDTAQWNALAQAWYQDAAAAGLWVAHWATGEWWGTDYKLSSYVWNNSQLNTARPPASVIEAQAAPERRSVNVNGAEFGPLGTALNPTSTLSNANPGVYDRDWHYDTQGSFDYLASRGIRSIRLALRWERIQPSLGAALDTAELDRLVAAVGRAKKAGLTVVLNIHNYGAYWLSDGTQGVRQPIGSTAVTQAHFSDLWRRLSQQFAAEPAVVGYGLMNEPVGMNGSGTLTAAQVWEKASQAAVDAVRATGDNKLILVPGYEWSAAVNFPIQHPKAWIADRARNIRYEAHQYWDRGASGAYANSYAAELADAQSRGYSEAPPTKAVVDFDGNGTTDLALFRPTTGQWYVAGASTTVEVWGSHGDIPVPGDYDGNGKVEPAVFRPATGQWFVKGTASSVTAWGSNGDIPVPGDYDGNGTTDLAIFRPGTGQWFVKGTTSTVTAWGSTGDIPVPADYDGDGTTDLAVYRPTSGQWYLAAPGATVTAWGTAGDIPVPGDYDGIGKTDLAIFRPSTGHWFVRGLAVTAWGVRGDVPVPGDYDGNGKTDLAVFRPYTGEWFVNGAASPVTSFGVWGDIPLPLPPSVRLSL